MFSFPLFDAISELYPTMFPRNNNPWAILQAQTNEESKAVGAERSPSQHHVASESSALSTPHHEEFASDRWPLNIIEDQSAYNNQPMFADTTPELEMKASTDVSYVGQ
uniref:Uncharacterized protein n=1 Tax=Panagrolaimus sp. JU765 TaxID=591449 RepID=A0AC34QIL5_9BILA